MDLEKQLLNFKKKFIKHVGDRNCKLIDIEFQNFLEKLNLYADNKNIDIYFMSDVEFNSLDTSKLNGYYEIDDDIGFYYYVDGQLHREGGPAASSYGDLFYYKHGELHRLDGPAYITEFGEEGFFCDGIQYNSLEDIYCHMNGIDEFVEG